MISERLQEFLLLVTMTKEREHKLDCVLNMLGKKILEIKLASELIVSLVEAGAVM